jgi:transposase-like protein
VAQFAVISSSDPARTDRWDASFWIKLTEMLRMRGISRNDTQKVKDVIKELNERGEIPRGAKTVARKPECPSCMSWFIDAMETTIVHTIDGKKTTTYSASFDCRNCHLHWVLESGSNEQMQ